MNKTYGPYEPVRKAGNFLYVSGQIGLDPTTKTTAVDVSAQTEQALKNLESILEGVGASLQNVIKTTVFLTNMDHFTTMNEAYEKVFIVPRPARSTVAAHELPRVGDRPLLVEIEAVAYTENI
jgi:2-iminobutanoate/2-iminopropanoate deaminase